MAPEQDKRIDLADFPLGSHLCLFYETHRDLLDMLVPYFKGGIDNNQSCIWVTPEPTTVEEAQRELARHLPEIGRYLADRTIEIFSLNDWYLETGEWDPNRVIDRIHQKLRDALSRGHVGLRLNGSSAWLQRQGPESFRIYESSLHEIVAGQPLIVLCTFPLDQTPATDLLDVADSHLFVGAMRNGRCQVLETPELRMTKEELVVVNNELVDAVRRGALRPFSRTSTESVAERNLTAREREVLGWAAKGKSAWEIGRILGITKRTVDEHVAHAVQKLGAVNRVQAIAIAVRDGVIRI